jgi:hypothetical protein
MPQRQKGTPDERKARWARFLTGVVGESKAVSVAVLDETLKGATGRKGDARGEIYAYLGGRQIAYKVRAFGIGEALNWCGVRWASGALALFAAGHLAEFAYALADLARRGFTIDAAIMALCAAKAVDGIGDARDMLATVVRPERYAESDLRDPQVDAAFRIAAAVARESRDLSFEIRESRIASEVRSMVDRRPELWRDKRLRAIRLAGTEPSPKGKNTSAIGKARVAL